MGQFFRLDSSFATKLGLGAPSARKVDSTSSSGISVDPSSVTTASLNLADPPGGA